MVEVTKSMRDGLILVLGITVGAFGAIVAKDSKIAHTPGDTLAAVNCANEAPDGQNDDVFFLSCGGIY